jgi:hypothetical protein
VPEVAKSRRRASLKLGGGEGVMARIVERAVEGRTGLGGAAVAVRGRKCVDIFVSWCGCCFVLFIGRVKKGVVGEMAENR